MSCSCLTFFIFLEQVLNLCIILKKPHSFRSYPANLGFTLPDACIQLEIFIEGVEAFCNSRAAWTVEKNALKNLYSTFGRQDQSEEGRSFIDHVAKNAED